MCYKIEYAVSARKDIERLKKDEPAAFKKFLKFIQELIAHPTTGTGKPHQLHGDRAGQWSRRITDKHRLVYTIDDNKVIVLVLTAYGHYDDK